MELLLKASADKHAADDCGSTALHLAATRGHSEVVKLLLEAGAHKDAVDDYGVTALQLAAMCGHSNVVKLLLEAGAHKDAANRFGSTALHMAAGAVAGFGLPEVVKLLLEAGSERNVAQNDGRTALHHLGYTSARETGLVAWSTTGSFGCGIGKPIVSLWVAGWFDSPLSWHWHLLGVQFPFRLETGPGVSVGRSFLASAALAFTWPRGCRVCFFLQPGLRFGA